MLKALLLAFLSLLCCSLSANAAEVSVFAASSLTDALTEVAQSYEQQHPENRLLLNFAGSQTLAMQIEQGAPADLFISASQMVMERLQKTELVSDVQPLLGNRLALAVRADLQPPLKRIEDLARPGLLLIIGNPQVPIGHYTRRLFAGLASDPAYGSELLEKIERNVVSEEGRVKAIIAKLLLGEADVGIVYRSDINNDRLNVTPLPEKLNPLAIYPLAKVKGSGDQSEQYYSFLQSRTATDIFRRHGFMTRGEL